jgi:hypothetical protein
MSTINVPLHNLISNVFIIFTLVFISLVKTLKTYVYIETTEIDGFGVYRDDFFRNRVGLPNFQFC